MITRSKSKALKRESEVIASKRTKKKTKTVRIASSDNIDVEPLPMLVAYSEKQLAKTLPVTEKPLIELTTPEPISNPKPTLTPISTLYGIDWEPIIRKTFNDAQYETALAVWKHILTTSDTCVQLPGPLDGVGRANGPSIIVLTRNDKGIQEKSNLHLIDDLKNVYIQSFHCRIGTFERPITTYLESKKIERAMGGLEVMGWVSTEPNPCAGAFY